ncbi:MAG: hypothetical protein J6Y94_01385 [Bacteriovoracaceae bacterium]|nr:hypothetical protein [Bacteriovoracaceae bacterium]
MIIDRENAKRFAEGDVLRRLKNRILIIIRRRSVVLSLALMAYVFLVFVLPDLVFTRQHVLYREDINSKFNMRMQRYINAQILTSCPLTRRDLILVDERLANEGSNFFYTAVFNYKHRKKLPGEVRLVELSNGHIELKLIRCPGQTDNLTVASNRSDTVLANDSAANNPAAPMSNDRLETANRQITEQLAR